VYVYHFFFGENEKRSITIPLKTGRGKQGWVGGGRNRKCIPIFQEETEALRWLG